MYRFRPSYTITSRSIWDFPHKSVQAASIMLMLSNNLDYAVAQHPHELITYGGNGAVFQNWAQYLHNYEVFSSEMTDEQTLVLYSGHPLGLFPSHKDAPRVVVTNGMMIPNYSSKDDWERFNALGVTQYGQMTAGSFMYIGPTGNCAWHNHYGSECWSKRFGRKIWGKLFVSSGLGGMSGHNQKPQ
jgi:urocanate hydratase